ncbi:MAG: ABC transporter permease [Rhodospirillaceae bacterium]
MNKLRSTLTMLGIVIGVAAVITMLAIGSGAQARLEEQIRSIGANLLTILPGTIKAGGVRLVTGSRVSLSEDDARDIMQHVAAVETAAPMLRSNGQVIAGQNNWSTIYYGVTTEFFDARSWSISLGKGIDTADVSSAAKVAVLGETVALNLFGEENPVGKTVRVNKVPLQVVGVLSRKGQNTVGYDQDDVLVVPITTARQRILGGVAGRQRSVHSITVKVTDGADMETTEKEITALLRERHRLQASQEDDFTVRNLAEMIVAQEESSRIMTLFLAAVASISLLVGGIGIMNMMIVSVTERTHEIGLRMAVGARRSDIRRQFLAEAFTLAVLGGIVGVAAGIGGAYAITRFSGWPVTISISSVAIALGFAASVGVFFGMYPARRASMLVPIDALRHN